MQTSMRTSTTFVLAIVLGLFVFRTGALDLASCASALAPIFSGAQGHQCVQLTITTASASSPTVNNAQGNVYFNRYYDGLVNQDSPSFAVVSSATVGCNRGLAQPFSADQVSSRMANKAFDVLITREGVLRVPSSSSQSGYQNVTLGCKGGALPGVGFDASGNVFTVQAKLFELSQGCPTTVVGSSC